MLSVLCFILSLDVAYYLFFFFLGDFYCIRIIRRKVFLFVCFLLNLLCFRDDYCAKEKHSYRKEIYDFVCWITFSSYFFYRWPLQSLIFMGFFFPLIQVLPCQFTTFSMFLLTERRGNVFFLIKRFWYAVEMNITHEFVQCHVNFLT